MTGCRGPLATLRPTALPSEASLAQAWADLKNDETKSDVRWRHFHYAQCYIGAVKIRALKVESFFVVILGYKLLKLITYLKKLKNFLFDSQNYYLHQLIHCAVLLLCHGSLGVSMVVEVEVGGRFHQVRGSKLELNLEKAQQLQQQHWQVTDRETIDGKICQTDEIKIQVLLSSSSSCLSCLSSSWSLNCLNYSQNYVSW